MKWAKAMFRLIEDLPPHVLGVEASGQVTHEDYQNLLIPKVEELLARGPVDMLYAIGDDFTGFDLEASTEVDLEVNAGGDGQALVSGRLLADITK